MSLWRCKHHGLTGPGACCGDAERAEVVPFAPPPTVTFTKPSLPAVPPEEWIEAVAQAIRDAHFGNEEREAWTAITESGRKMWRERARAAYAALREEMEK